MDVSVFASITQAKRSKRVGQSNFSCLSQYTCLKSNAGLFSQIAKICNLTKTIAGEKQSIEMLTETWQKLVRVWPKGQTILIKPWSSIKDCFTSNVWTFGHVTNISWQAELLNNVLKIFKNITCNKKMFDEQCFVMWPKGQTFCLKK